ncbi:hypothetical protein PoB_000957000 [Plakobranchus ocellatus]|uniref:Uncharacterized protein n=1 Tax=Plakobranchus ocellatus TaxID=259542 RepID=A0AAV3YKQ1_9GAST|nr:hypothetical protein PoB_000957000 [Plakobranchus ocellatus]
MIYQNNDFFATPPQGTARVVFPTSKQDFKRFDSSCTTITAQQVEVADWCQKTRRLPVSYLAHIDITEYDKTGELTAVADIGKLLFVHCNWPQHGGDAFCAEKPPSRRVGKRRTAQCNLH